MGHRIVIMAGGTGGHVFPALAVAEYLKSQGWDVSWLGTEKGLENRVVPAQAIDIDYLSVAGIRGKGLISKFTAVFRLLKACAQAARILRRRKPDVVLGMGGFVAGPGGLMARVLGIPLVIHEQNRVPGTTNRLLARLASRVLEAFPDSFSKKQKALCTGNPLRKEFSVAKEKPARQAGQVLKLLVVGGSQGAQVLNENVPEGIHEFIAALKSSADAPQVQVKHQTGQVMEAAVKARYKALGIDAEVSAFISDIVAVYQWADLIICRAGAMTVSEVAAMGLPGIFVPLANAIDDHQTANAKYLTERGAGQLLIQKDLNASAVKDQLLKALEHLDAMSQAAKQCARLDATKSVADICLQEVRA